MGVRQNSCWFLDLVSFNKLRSELSFTADGEVVQKQFYVAQVKVKPDGKSGKFELLK